MIDVLGATRAALGAALNVGRNKDEDGRAAARRTLSAIATAWRCQRSGGGKSMVVDVERWYFLSLGHQIELARESATLAGKCAGTATQMAKAAASLSRMELS